jgi:hypothetical protein
MIQPLNISKKFLILFFASTLFGCWSSTGDIEYKPAAKSLVEKQSETSITIAILDFTDQRFSIKKYRSKRKNNLIAVFFGGYKNPIRKVYSNQKVALDVMDAVENLFKANGFNVKKDMEAFQILLNRLMKESQ